MCQSEAHGLRPTFWLISVNSRNCDPPTIGMVRLEPAGDQSVLDAEFLDTGDENEYNPKLVPVDISSYLGTPELKRTLSFRT